MRSRSSPQHDGKGWKTARSRRNSRGRPREAGERPRGGGDRRPRTRARTRGGQRGIPGAERGSDPTEHVDANAAAAAPPSGAGEEQGPGPAATSARAAPPAQGTSWADRARAGRAAPRSDAQPATADEPAEGVCSPAAGCRVSPPAHAPVQTPRSPTPTNAPTTSTTASSSPFCWCARGAGVGERPGSRSSAVPSRPSPFSAGRARAGGTDRRDRLHGSPRLHRHPLRPAQRAADAASGPPAPRRFQRALGAQRGRSGHYRPRARRTSAWCVQWAAAELVLAFGAVAAGDLLTAFAPPYCCAQRKRWT